jgi:AI-2 transport protein TqsA
LLALNPLPDKKLTFLPRWDNGTAFALMVFVSPSIPRPAAKTNYCQVITTIAALFIVIGGLKLSQGLLVPVLLGIMIAAASSSIVTKLLKRGLPPIAVSGIVLLIDLAALGLFGGLIVLAASDLHTLLPKYVARLEAGREALIAYLARHGFTHVTVPSPLDSDLLPRALGGMADQFVSVASISTVVVLVVFFTLCEVTVLGDKLRAVVANADEQFNRLNRIVREIQRYLVVKTLTSLIAAVGVFIVLKLCGVGLALLLAAAMFILHFIPNVGAAIATVPAVLIAIADRGWGIGAIVAGGYIAIIIFAGNLLEPRLLGKTLGFSPLFVLLGMLFWGWVWGPMGALLSVPLMVVVKIILENIPDLAWMARLAGSEVEETPKGTVTPIKERVSNPMLRPPRYILGLGQNPNG